MEKTNINLNCSSNNTPDCTVQSRGISFNINQPCNGTTRVYFENLSCIPGEFTVQIFSNNNPPCTMTAIIEFQNGEAIERIISPGSSITFFTSNIIKRISIRCDGNPTGFCNGSGFVDRLFCLCCSDNNNNCCNTNCNTGFSNNNCCNANCNTGFNNSNCCNSNCNSCCSNRCSHTSDDHCKKDDLINALLSLHKPECKPQSGNKKADLLDILAKINLSL